MVSDRQTDVRDKSLSSTVNTIIINRWFSKVWEKKTDASIKYQVGVKLEQKNPDDCSYEYRLLGDVREFEPR